MNKFTKYILGILVICLLSVVSALGQTVYSVQIKEDIGPNAWRTLKNALKEAKAANSAYFFSGAKYLWRRVELCRLHAYSLAECRAHEDHRLCK